MGPIAANNRAGASRGRKAARRLRPTVMALEGRTLLATYMVSSIGDDVNTMGTLRWAIGQANSNGGADTIAFSSLFDAPQTIVLTGTPLTLTDTAGTTITGPGANLLTISGDKASSVFDIQGGSASVSGLTVTEGKARRGGGFYNQNGTLSLMGVTVTGNYASYFGGGLNNSRGTTSLANCTVSGNSTGGAGGGLYTYGGTLSLSNCTVSGDTSGGSGGGLTNRRDLLNQGGTLSLTNCTISNNSTESNGGGLDMESGVTTLTNCTITGNTSGNGGSGIYVNSQLSRDVPTLTNTIVAGNHFNLDIFGAVDPSSANNFIGDGGGMSGISDGSQGNQIGTAQAPINPLLASLGDYGGPTRTMPLLPGSPAIAGGRSRAGIPGTDQRGLPRQGHTDIGAFQSQGFTLVPAADSTPQTAEVNEAFAHPLAVAVTAMNSVEPVDGGVITFIAPSSGASAALSAATMVIARNQDGVSQAGVTATANDTTGIYLVTATAAGAGAVSFDLKNTEAASLVLTTPRDVVDEFDGLTSLREAVAYANSHPGPDTITFDPTVFGRRPLTIRLTGGPLVLTDPATTTIIGPGAGRLTLQGDGTSRVFEVQGGSLALSGLTIAGGRADDGGGIRNDGGRLVLTGVTLRGNSARVLGGGLFNGGTATLRNVTVAGNAARFGGGIANFGTLSLARVNLRANRALFARALLNGHTVRLIRR